MANLAILASGCFMDSPALARIDTFTTTPQKVLKYFFYFFSKNSEKYAQKFPKNLLRFHEQIYRF